MKFSIITVVRNGREQIAQTVESVLSQGVAELEYIIIDGASTDGTLEALAPYRDRLARVVSEPDNGIYDAMNKGIALATGDIVGMINCGDRYLPEAFAAVAEAMAGRDLGNCVFWGDVIYSKLGRVRGFRPENLTRGAFAPHPSMFVGREVYRRIGAYDTGLRFLGDYDFMYRAVHRYKLEVVYRPVDIAFYLEGGFSDCHIMECLRDELTVKLRYGQPGWKARALFALKVVKNLPRMMLAKR